MPRIWVDEDVTLPSGEVIQTRSQVIICGRCQKPGGERYSLGIFAGYYCGPCWDQTGIRKEGPEGFDPMDAGESYDPEPCVGGL